MAELMGNPLAKKRELKLTDSVIDLTLTSGIYMTLSYSVAQDLPSDVKNSSGLLIIFEYNYARRYLIWFNNEGGLYLRWYWDSVWYDWMKFN